MPLAGLIDIDLERKRMTKEIGRLEGLKKGIDSKLKNEKFLANAPEDVVANEREKQQNVTANLEKLRLNLESLDAAE